MFFFSELLRPKPHEDDIVSFDETPEPPHPEYDNTWRAKIFFTLESSDYSPLAKGLSIVQLLIVLASVITFMMGTLPEWWDKAPKTILEWIFGVYFTVDYLLRLFTCRVWYRWIYQPFNLIDLVSTAPFWIDLILKGVVKRLAVLRVLRLLRVFRVIRAAKAGIYVRILIRTLKNSRDALLLLLFVISILVSLFASVLFFAEQTGQRFNKTLDNWFRLDGSDSPFQSIFHCMWWAIVSITTVGYGDTFPVTLAGKIVGACCMLSGVVMIAFPIAVLGNNFSNAWNDFQSQQSQKKALKKLHKGSRKGSKGSTGTASISGAEDHTGSAVPLTQLPGGASDPPQGPITINIAPTSLNLVTDPTSPNFSVAALREREIQDTLLRLKQLLNADGSL